MCNREALSKQIKSVLLVVLLAETLKIDETITIVASREQLNIIYVSTHKALCLH